MGRSPDNESLRPVRRLLTLERNPHTIPLKNREHGKSIYKYRGKQYRVNSDQAKILQDVGAFRTVTASSLREHLYDNNDDRFHKDLRNLEEQRLLSQRFWIFLVYEYVSDVQSYPIK